ncbi:MAG: hypothetical protein Q9207_005621 [Kuettlingeria erythrocarpa]
MWFESTAYNKYPDLQNAVSKILDATPGMSMTSESAKKIQEYLHEHATTNENTLLERLINLVVKTTKIALANHDLNGQVKEVVHTMLNKIAEDQDYVQDGLESIRDKSFVRGFLPLQTIENKALGLTDPKPDMTYGLKIPKEPIPGKGLALLERDVEAMVKICPEMQHAFFAIDFGACGKSLEEVQNQSIRTGADLVEARRRLNAKAATAKAAREKQSAASGASEKQAEAAAAAETPVSAPLPPEADLNSMAFTVSWVPRMAELHAHWYEENVGSEGIWHMTLVKGYMFYREDSLKEFRKDIGNILAWGLYKRKEEVLRMMKDLYPDY